MFGVECFDTHDVPISHYTQWDINQTLKIVLYGMDDGYMKNAPYVHFANIKMSEALVVRSTLQGDDTVLVDIPNQLLQEPYPLLVYVYLNDSSDASSQRTIVKIEIPVHKRARPSDYEYVENIDKITAEVIKQEIYDDLMDEVRSGNIAYPYVTFIDESTGKHVNLKVSDEKFGLYVDSTNRQLLDTEDIVNNLMTNSPTKVLSASMGTALKNMIDVIPDQIDEKIDEKIEEHDSSPTSHSDIRDSIAEIENKIDDITLDDTISGSGILTTTDTLVNSSPIEVRIKGKTWVNRWRAINNMSNGITVSTDGTGLVTITGTATANAYIGHNITSIAKNINLTLVRSTSTTGIKINVHAYNGSSFVAEVVSLSGSSDNNKATGNTGNRDLTHLYYNFEIASGTTVNASFRVMLVEGTEAPDCFTPCDSITSVEPENLVTAGKNLLRTPSTGQPGGGVSVVKHDDGSITFNGTVTNVFWFYDTVSDFYLPSGTYTLSGFSGYPEALREGIRLELIEGGVSQKRLAGFYTPTFTASNAVTARFVISAVDGAEFDNITIYPQLQLGSTATAYEPPTVTTTPLPEVELRSLPNGTCDELVIKADGTCEVERKTKFVEFDGSADEIIILDTTKEKTQVFEIKTVDRLKISSNIVCDILPTITGYDIPSIFGGDSGSIYIAVNKSDAPTVEEFRAWLAEHKPKIVRLANKTTEPQSPVTLPSFPSDKSNIYTASNVPTAGLTVRYWKKGGELVANLYKLLWNHLSQSETS